MPHGWLSADPTRSMVVAMAAMPDAKRAALKSAALMKVLKAIPLQLVQGRHHRADRGHGDRGVNPHAID